MRKSNPIRSSERSRYILFYLLRWYYTLGWDKLVFLKQVRQKVGVQRRRVEIAVPMDPQSHVHSQFHTFWSLIILTYFDPQNSWPDTSRGDPNIQVPTDTNRGDSPKIQDLKGIAQIRKITCRMCHFLTTERGPGLENCTERRLFYAKYLKGDGCGETPQGVSHG